MSEACSSSCAVLVAVALLAAGCGGSSDSASSDATPTAEWADGLCSAITTWTSSLTTIGDTLKGGNLSKDSLTSAVDEAKSATETFTSDLESLGKPDTEAGQQAKDAVDQLSTEIQADMTKIEDAVDGASGVAGILAAVPVISSTLDDGRGPGLLHALELPGPRRQGRARERLQGVVELQRAHGRAASERSGMKDYTTRVELMAIPIVAVLFGIGARSRRSRRTRVSGPGSSSASRGSLLAGAARSRLYTKRHPHPAADTPAPAALPPPRLRRTAPTGCS